MVDLMSVLLLSLGRADMSGPVAVHAAYVIHTQQPAVQKCCGACREGMIVHGDDHKTPCPCQPDCECKAVRHPPVILKCEGGKCSPKK